MSKEKHTRRYSLSELYLMLSKNDELLYCYSEGYCAEKLNTSINAVQHIRAYYKKHPKRLKEIYCDVLTQDLIENK